MGYTALTAGEITGGKPITGTGGTGDKIKDNFDYLYGVLGTISSGLLNGSFEASASGVPFNWTVTEYTGGTFTLDTTSPRHGGKIVKFNHPGGASNGGGDIESDYTPISPDIGAYLNVVLWATNAGVRIKVMVEYFTAAQVTISTETLYNDNSTNPTSATPYSWLMTVPATARYCKVTLLGGDTDTDPGVSTDIYFDNVIISAVPLVYVAGSNIIAHARTVTPGFTNTSAAKKYEFVATRNGTLTIDFDIWGAAATGYNVYGRIYVNGAAVGTIRNTALTTPQTYSEDIAVKAGDLVQLYCWVQNASHTGYADEFKLQSNNYTNEGPIYD